MWAGRAVPTIGADPGGCSGVQAPIEKVLLQLTPRQCCSAPSMLNKIVPEVTTLSSF